MSFKKKEIEKICLDTRRWSLYCLFICTVYVYVLYILAVYVYFGRGTLYCLCIGAGPVVDFL
jgi:hypothetical protein